MTLVLVLAVFIGITLGTMGGGGTILAVPLLNYVAGLEPRQAIAASLFIVGVTSAVSVAIQARRGVVRWRTGLLFGVASMVGAFVGGLLGGRLPGTILMVAFALMMLATAGAMLRGSRRAAAHTPQQDTAAEAVPPLPLARIAVDGAVVGLITGVVGAGGGFLVVPALVLLGRLPMRAAVATSLLVISLKSFAGLAGYLTAVDLDWPFILAITAVTIGGSLVGMKLSSRIPERALKTIFGWFVLGMGILVLVSELLIA